MNTEDFISILAKNAAVPQRTPAIGWWPVALAVMLSGVLMAATLGLRPNLPELATLPWFWLKCSFVAALAVPALRAVRTAAIPGARFRAVPWLLMLAVAAMAAIAAMTLADAAPADRARQFWGSTWRTCPFLIALLSLPIFAALLHGMRALAPTRLRVAGAVAGFAAGATAALLYCLHCPELAPAFIAFWYLLGILIPTALGALAAPRLLAW